MREKVSIALCTYNGGRFLGEQLASLARQTRRPDEVIICDDGSTDDTLQVAAVAAEELGLLCHIHRNEQNLGFSDNFAQATRKCTGDYIFYCDQDDSWLPEKIAQHLAAFAEHPNALLVASDSSLVDEQLKPSGDTQFGVCHFGAKYHRRLRDDSFRVFLSLRPIPGHAMSIRRKLAEQLFPIPNHWPHDGWSCLLASALGPVVVLNRCLTLYRRHSSQAIGTFNTSLTQMAAQMGAGQPDPFEGDIRNFQIVRDRISGVRESIPDAPTKLRLIDNKITFLRARSDMRRKPGRRFGLVLREAVSRRYFTCGQGWLSMARDILGK